MSAETFGPAIVLVAPQMGENIGAAARVMGNFGLSDLRIVAPRDGWPNPAAETLSAGAFEGGVVTPTVFEKLEEAVSDLNYLIATTARQRGMEKAVFSTDEATAKLASHAGKTGVLFGAEKSGLPNDAVALCDAILTYPVNTAFASLNLAQAVGVFAHAWAFGTTETAEAGLNPPADRQALIGMMEHFEDELDRAGFFFPPEKKEVMIQNLRNAFSRAGWTDQETRTFRGAVKALALGRGKARIDRKD
ncbi:MAG: rRNA methyltransferase [Ponticaulis sp.]|nr:rRNA methyltransferase [Ponticaulis sp.]|tara:strand:+ start:75338 stop:76081 length:744 start_codon:yes stop_codon:yes gene_type:complete